MSVKATSRLTLAFGLTPGTNSLVWQSMFRESRFPNW